MGSPKEITARCGRCTSLFMFKRDTINLIRLDMLFLSLQHPSLICDEPTFEKSAEAYVVVIGLLSSEFHWAF